MTEQQKRPAPSDANWKEREAQAHRDAAANPPKFPASGGTFDRLADGTLREMRYIDKPDGTQERVPHKPAEAPARDVPKATPAPAASQASGKTE